MTEVDDPNGNELGYRYDSVGRLTAIVDASVSPEVPYTSYAYDDRRADRSITNATGTVDYAYNDLGQVESITADGQEVDYTYTDLGQRDTMTLPGSRVVDYGYSTTTDELESIDDFSTQPGPTRYSWTLDGQLDEIDRPPDALDSDLDIVTNYGYDAAGRLTGISHSQDSVELAEYGYTLDKQGNRTGVTITGADVANGSESYTYTALDQLATASYTGGGSASFTYDANGNRETVTSGGETVTYGYNALGELNAISSTDPGFSTLAIDYDSNGNRIQVSDGATTTRAYTYDWSNRLTEADVDGVDTDYTYLGDDTRATTTTSAGTTDYTVDRAGGLPQVVDDGTSAYLHDVTGNSVGIDDTSGDATYPLSDALGSVRATVDGSGAAIGSADYDAWGNLRTSDTTGYAFGWTGQQYDESSDLQYLNARYYSPGTGQFLSRDTLEPNGSGATAYNPYAYANGNPTTLTDPSGHLASLSDFGGGIAGAFLYLAYILECFTSGSCRYAGEHQAASSELTAARTGGGGNGTHLINMCSGTFFSQQITDHLSRRFPNFGITDIGFAVGCPGSIGRTSHGAFDYGHSHTLGIVIGPTTGEGGDICKPSGSNGRSSTGLNYSGPGPSGKYYLGDFDPYKFNVIEFSSTSLSRCHSAVVATVLQGETDAANDTGTVVSLLTTLGCAFTGPAAPICEIGGQALGISIFMSGPISSENIDRLNQNAIDAASEGSVIYDWNPHESFITRDVYTQHDFFTLSNASQSNPCEFARAGNSEGYTLMEGAKCTSPLTSGGASG